MTRRARIARTAALVAALAVATTGCIWRSYGFDDANTRDAAFERGIAPETVGGLGEVWRIDGTVGNTSTPAFYGGFVYFGGWDGTLRAARSLDGALEWETTLGGAALDPSPLVTADRVVIGDAGGSLHSVDRVTGAPQWSVLLDPHPQANLYSSAVEVDGLVIIGVASTELALVKPDYTFRGSVVALDAETGDEVWRFYTTDDDEIGGAGVSVWSSAAVDRDRGLVYIGTGNAYEPPAGPLSDALLALDYTTGDLVWKRQFTEGDVYTIFGPIQGPDADIGAAPNLFRIGDRDVVGVGDKAGVYAVLDRDTGETVWGVELPEGSRLGGIMTTAAVADGRIFVTSNIWGNFLNFQSPSNTGAAFALDAENGDILWETPLPSPIFGAVTHANGVVFTPSVKGTIYGLDAETGAILWSDTPDPNAQLGGGVSVVGGRLYVPYGFWFFTAPANPVGGLVAYGLPPAGNP